jgi:hypothetical protein
MNLLENIYKFLEFVFEKISFRTKPKQEIFYDYHSTHSEYEYEFIPLYN